MAKRAPNKKLKKRKKASSTKKKFKRKAKKKDNFIRKELKKIEREERRIEKREKAIIIAEKKILSVEKDIRKGQKKIVQDEEKILFKVKKLKFRRRHLFEFTRMIAGALLGTSLGVGVIKQQNLAESLSWGNVIAITIAALIIGMLLVWKTERKRKLKNILKIKRITFLHILKKIATIYIISLIVVTISAWLFLPEPVTFLLFIKILFISAFSAVTGSITFSLI